MTPVCQLVARSDGTWHAKCGRTAHAGPVTSPRAVPAADAGMAAWGSYVTCPACLARKASAPCTSAPPAPAPAAPST